MGKLRPPQEPKRELAELTGAVDRVSDELRGIRGLLVALLNEYERRNDERAAKR